MSIDVKDLVEGKYYYGEGASKHIFIYDGKANDKRGRIIINKNLYEEAGALHVRGLSLKRLATTEEIAWLDLCIANNKYMDKPVLDKEALLKEAKERYPKGARFRCIKNPDIIFTVNSTPYNGAGEIRIESLKSEWSINMKGGMSNPVIYENGIWADIVEDKPIFAVGDTVEVLDTLNVRHWDSSLVGYRFELTKGQVKMIDRNEVFPDMGDYYINYNIKDIKLVNKVKQNKVKKDGKQDKNSRQDSSKGSSIKIGRLLPRVRAGQRPSGAPIRGRARRATIEGRRVSYTASLVSS